MAGFWYNVRRMLHSVQHSRRIHLKAELAVH
jgi:hypothetical protein